MRNRLSLWASAGALIAALSAPRAQELSGNPGAFAPVPIGGRGTALAGAQTAAPSGAEAIVYNPAALASTQEWGGGYYYSNMYALVPYHFTTGSYHLPGKPIVVGAGWIQNGDEVYAENEVLLSGSYTRGWLDVGATYKLRFAGTGSGGDEFTDENGVGHQVSGSALGLLGFDLGAIARPFGPKYAMGLVVKDLFSRIAWSTRNAAGTAKGDYAEYVPVSMRLGMQFHPDPFLLMVVDIQPPLYSDAYSKLASGLEITPLEALRDGWLKQHVHDLLALRVGYGRNLFTDEASHKLAIGAGLAYACLNVRLAVDMGYEWVYNFDGNNNLRIGFSASR
jgi:hypothetical protein